MPFGVALATLMAQAVGPVFNFIGQQVTIKNTAAEQSSRQASIDQETKEKLAAAVARFKVSHDTTEIEQLLLP
jgi:uncharacterized surface anchored protein